MDQAFDPRAWGRDLENRAIAMWSARTGHPAFRLPDHAKADALYLPHLVIHKVVGIPALPYFLEVKGRRKPLLDSDHLIGIKQPVLFALQQLAKSSRLPVIWLVVSPDAILSLRLDFAPIPFEIGSSFEVFFRASDFEKHECAENRAFFEGCFR